MNKSIILVSVVQTHTRRCFHISSAFNRLRSEWRKDRKPANTRLSDETIIEERKAYGGGKKQKAVAASNGNYILESKNIELTMKIKDVLHSEAGAHYKEQKIINKGCVLAVEGSDLLPDIDTNLLLAENSPSEARERLNRFISNGELLARVTTRPGQTGKCDGYIIEGQELEAVLQKITA